MRISTRSWPAWLCTSEAYLAACWAWAMWSMRILRAVSGVKRGAISARRVAVAGPKLVQQRDEISRCWPRAGGTPEARMPARPALVARKWRRLSGSMRILLWSERMESEPGLAGRVDRLGYPVKAGSGRFPGPLPRRPGARWGTAARESRRASAPGVRARAAPPRGPRAPPAPPAPPRPAAGGPPPPGACRRAAPSGLPRRPGLEALAQHLLVELADARLGHRLDDRDAVGQRPLSELRPGEVEDLLGLERGAGLGQGASQRG